MSGGWGSAWAGQHTQAAGQSGLLGPGQSDWQQKGAQRALAARKDSRQAGRGPGRVIRQIRHNHVEYNKLDSSNARKMTRD